MFAGNRRAVRTFVVACGTFSRTSRAVAETSVCVHHRIVRRKQIYDFVHVVEVSDATRDRLQ